MAAVAPLGPDRAASPAPSPARSPAQPRLRLAPGPARGARDARSVRSTRRRDAAYAATLALLLGVGIVGVLLLNTAMQTQADRIAATKSRLADLALSAQVLQTAVDRAQAPGALAARARALRLRPATRVVLLSVSGRGSAAPRARAG